MIFQKKKETLGFPFFFGSMRGDLYWAVKPPMLFES